MSGLTLDEVSALKTAPVLRRPDRQSSINSEDDPSRPSHFFETISPSKHEDARDGHAKSLGHVVPQKEPIAIIGMGCRLPGHCSSPLKLWDVLRNGTSTHCEVPRWRYDPNKFYHPDIDRPGSINSTGGYFIQEDTRQFEPSFFGINNLEAMSMDPQQRKLLEVVFECFESAGASLEQLSGADVGCYVANFALDFPIIQLHDPEYINRYTAVGAAPNILANRVSHIFNLKGPSVVMDTACSSSLYALHIACTALDAGECRSAIVASANLVQAPQFQMLATRAGILSSSSTCRTFDAAADGYGRADGVGSLYLKRLSDAIKDKDPIRAVIRGSAVNANGRTPGIMQPSADGQEQVIRKAYLRAGLTPDETDYVEAHGTGTEVGDPIEVDAISRVFVHKTGRPTFLASVKSNLGHSEASSGISSVIKCVLALENSVIPPSIGIQQLNPKICSPDFNIEIVKSPMAWPQTRCPRVSINSFGFGGANSHIILESPKRHVGDTCQINGIGSVHNGQRHLLLPLTAHTAPSLTRRMDELSGFNFPTNVSKILGKTAYTLANRSTRLSRRGYLVVNESLSGVNMAVELQNVSTVSSSPQLAQLVLVFTGQGAQWPKMAHEIYGYYPTFTSVIAALDTYLANFDPKPWWTLDDFFSGLSVEKYIDVDDPRVSQTICTVVQIGLVDLLRDWGIQPIAVVGHSSGEIAAAYAAGYLSKQQATALAYYRGVVATCREVGTAEGAMLAVGLDEPSTMSHLRESGLENKLVIACVNSPLSVTVSGDAEALEVLKDRFETLGIFNRKLRTQGTAYHSHHMRGRLGERYQNCIEKYLSSPLSTEDSKPCVDMVSTVTGSIVTCKQVIQASYWRANLENPVLFDPAVRVLLKNQNLHFIEVGPHCALQLPIKQISETSDFGKHTMSSVYDSTLVRNKSALHTLLKLAGELFIQGHELCFDKINQLHYTEKQVNPSLPTYPWQYSNTLLWKEPRAVEEFRYRKHRRHELLGSQVTGGNASNLTWRNLLSVKDVSWIADHRFGPTILFPAAGFISMAIEAICQGYDCPPSMCPGLQMRHVKFSKALPLADDGSPTEVFTELKQLPLSDVVSSNKWSQFQIMSLVDGEYSLHSTGSIRLRNNQSDQAISRTLHVSHKSMELQPVNVWYKKLRELDLNWGPSFKTAREFYTDRSKQRSEAFSRVQMNRGELDQCSGEYTYILHPTIIDSMLQLAFVAAARGRVTDLRPRIPVSIERLNINAVEGVNFEGQDLWNIEGAIRSSGFGTILANSELSNSEQQTLVQLVDTRATIYQGVGSEKSQEKRAPILRVCWKPDITFMYGDCNSLGRYIDLFGRMSSPQTNCNLDELLLLGAIDLVVHKDSQKRILLLNPSPHFHDALLSILGASSCYKRFSSLEESTVHELGAFDEHTVFSSEGGEVSAHTNNRLLDVDNYDLVVLNASEKLDRLPLLKLIELLPPTTQLIFTTSNLDGVDLQNLGRPYIFGNTSLTARSILIVAGSGEVLEPSTDLYLIGIDETAPINSELKTVLHAQRGVHATFIPFDTLSTSSIPENSRTIFTAEYEKSILSQLKSGDMERLRFMTNAARRLLWVTRGSLTEGQRPEAALVSGLSRVLMTEQPSMRFGCFDADLKSTIEVTSSNIANAFQRLDSDEKPDLEFIQRDDVVHVSRWIPDDTLNEEFQQKQEVRPSEQQLGNIKPCRMTIESAGQFDTIAFERDSPARTLEDNEVEVEAMCYGMNAKDLYLLSARFDTCDESCSCEFSGIVKRVGPKAKHLMVGDRVAVMAPGRYRTLEVVPEWACGRLLPDEDFQSTCTIPIVFSTALYALKHKANLQEGESVLIHSGSGGLGLAAIQIARLMNAKIYATAGTIEKRDFLAQKCGLPPEHLFSSRDSSFLPGILAITDGKGVDVVLNSLTGDLLHDSFRACAPFGRFIEVGKKDILDNGRLQMEAFRRDLSFMAFDLINLYHSESTRHQVVYQALIQESLQLLRENKIAPIEPRRVFDISDITQAFRYFSRSSRIGKVAVSMTESSSQVRALPNKYNTFFNPERTYLLIGCFGGIGRSITRWMFARGARYFVFISRSGLKRSSAAQLVQDLEQSGGKVHVITGDVSNVVDVDEAIRSACTPIGGVIAASMSVQAKNWELLSCEEWEQGIKAKVQGSWNLHNGLQTKHEAALDFFLMLSSVSGTVGSATESNYCAANCFMDHFARFRRSHGRPATSLGLGVVTEVGYLSEHPEMEAAYVRRGMQSITEDEMLQLVDLALSRPDGDGGAVYDEGMKAHILTGLELGEAKAQTRERGLSGLGDLILKDPRASLLAAAYLREIGPGAQGLASGTPSSSTGSPLARELREAMTQGVSLEEGIRGMLAVQFCRIVMLPEDQLDVREPLASFGLDSMLAAELRGFVFQTFKVDLPFMMILANKTTIHSVAEYIAQSLKDGTPE